VRSPKHRRGRKCDAVPDLERVPGLMSRFQQTATSTRFGTSAPEPLRAAADALSGAVRRIGSAFLRDCLGRCSLTWHGRMSPCPNGRRASAPADQLRDALAGETREASEHAVGGSYSVRAPQRRSQPAASSLELSLGIPDRLEGFRDRGEASGDLRPWLTPTGHERGLRARSDGSSSLEPQSTKTASST